MRFRSSFLLSLMLLLTGPALAQFLTVTGNFRVVEVDPTEMRLGVAQPEADPGVRQNWVYLRDNTRVLHRLTQADGSMVEQPGALQDALAVGVGDIIKVHGGRDFDGSINAKSVQLSGPPPAAGQPAAKNTVVNAAQATGAQLTYPESQWSGVVTDVTPEGALLDVGHDQLVRVPANALLSQDGTRVAMTELVPGDAVEAKIPKGTGSIVSATDQILTLQTPNGLTQIATSTIPAKQRAALTVPVLTKGGATLSLPLSDALAMQKSDGAAIVSSQIPTLSSLPSGGGSGVVLQSMDKYVLLVTPAGQVYKVARDGLAVSPGGGITFTPVNGKLKLSPGKGSPGKGNSLTGGSGKANGKGNGKGKGKNKGGISPVGF